LFTKIQGIAYIIIGIEAERERERGGDKEGRERVLRL
jgi:hypothetical protein